VDYSRLNTSHVFSVINGLSDHDAQYLAISNVVIRQRNKSGLVQRSIISEPGIITFKEMLSSDSWDSVFSNVDVNKSFNVFFNIFLMIFKHVLQRNLLQIICALISGSLKELKFHVSKKSICI
jgi:hypothetical protein